MPSGSQDIHETSGKQQSDYGASLDSLAKLYLSMGKYEAAEPLFREALDIAGKASGKQHPNYATSLHNFAGPI